MSSRAWIARSNIAMFKERLSAENDEGKRSVLRRLLAEEESKLRDLEQDLGAPREP